MYSVEQCGMNLKCSNDGINEHMLLTINKIFIFCQPIIDGGMVRVMMIGPNFPLNLKFSEV